jgi:hypothetical protein
MHFSRHHNLTGKVSVFFSLDDTTSIFGKKRVLLLKSHIVAPPVTGIKVG